jgi:hypothetical protein
MRVSDAQRTWERVLLEEKNNYHLKEILKWQVIPHLVIVSQIYLSQRFVITIVFNFLVVNRC